jgi:hypothetical protein
MIKKCDKPGCGKAGTCRAPKSRDLKEYWFFCTEHAAEYNKNWNYYADMTPDEIEEDWEEYMATFFVYINGELVFEYSYDTMEDAAAMLAWNEDKEDDYLSLPIQNFFIDYSIDNFVVGSSDFAWTDRTYVGDVDGDNYLTAADALCMRQLLAKVVDGSDFAQDRMDANQDGVINAKDQLTIRKALAA